MRISDWSSDVCSSDLGSNAQRLAAALVAAEKSIRTRALWTKYTPRQKEDAGWQLSFHSQLEDALAGGDIWVAFQPQYEIATRRIVGVAAPARWTHPTRGPIPIGRASCRERVCQSV